MRHEENLVTKHLGACVDGFHRAYFIRVLGVDFGAIGVAYPLPSEQ